MNSFRESGKLLSIVLSNIVFTSPRDYRRGGSINLPRFLTLGIKTDEEKRKRERERDREKEREEEKGERD